MPIKWAREHLLQCRYQRHGTIKLILLLGCSPAMSTEWLMLAASLDSRDMLWTCMAGHRQEREAGEVGSAARKAPLPPGSGTLGTWGTEAQAVDQPTRCRGPLERRPRPF